MKDKKIELGSNTAKNGFKNEHNIADKFNNWHTDTEPQTWLQTMGYALEEIEYVEAIILSGYKTDVQVQITIKLKKDIEIDEDDLKIIHFICKKKHPKRLPRAL